MLRLYFMMVVCLMGIQVFGQTTEITLRPGGYTENLPANTIEITYAMDGYYVSKLPGSGPQTRVEPVQKNQFPAKQLGETLANLVNSMPKEGNQPTKVIGVRFEDKLSEPEFRLSPGRLLRILRAAVPLMVEAGVCPSEIVVSDKYALKNVVRNGAVLMEMGWRYTKTKDTQLMPEVFEEVFKEGIKDVTDLDDAVGSQRSSRIRSLPSVSAGEVFERFKSENGQRKTEPKEATGKGRFSGYVPLGARIAF